MPIVKDSKNIIRNPAIYASYYPMLLQIAHEHGYALALHGSLQKDMDLIAVPWIQDAKPGKDLIEAILNKTGGYILDHDKPFLGHKPHGRLAYSIYIDIGMYFDISIMPRNYDIEHWGIDIIYPSQINLIDKDQKTKD